MAQQFKNNARALLVAGISDTDTSLVVESAKADLFPVANVGTGSIPSANSWFKVTLQDSAGAVEIVYVRTRTAGSGIFSNVIRAQESTTALSFLAGTVVGLRVTAGDVQSALGITGLDNTFTGDNTFSGDNTFNGNNDLTGTNAFTGANSFAGASSFAGSVSGQGLINLLYPVGSVYINATNSTNPGTLFGVGTWVAFGAGRVPVGFNSGNPLFDAAEETGGSADAVVAEHTHTMQAAGVHSHSYTTFTVGGPWIHQSSGSFAQSSTLDPMTTGTAGSHTHTIDSAGVSATNANYQPYITVYMWKRTA